DRTRVRLGAHAPVPRDGPPARRRRTAPAGRGRAPRGRTDALARRPGRRRAGGVPRREVARRAALVGAAPGRRLGPFLAARLGGPGPKSGESVAVEPGAGAERDRESQMCAGLVPAPEPLQALTEREVAEMRRRIDLEQRLECLGGALGLTGVVV